MAAVERQAGRERLRRGAHRIQRAEGIADAAPACRCWPEISGRRLW